MFLFVRTINVKNISKSLNITPQIKIDIFSFKIQSGYLKAFRKGNQT